MVLSKKTLIVALAVLLASITVGTGCADDDSTVPDGMGGMGGMGGETGK